ncbi:MAG: DUF1801 domain-containing protein [Gemmatimonadaceae bacterium]
MQSKAKTVADYLKELPAERRAAVETIRRTVKASVSPEIEEVMQYGMISYVIPHSVFPEGYHCSPDQPVPYAAVASQKQHLSIYLMPPYIMTEIGTWIRDEYKRKGRKLDMGKSCIRVKDVAELDLDVLAGAIKRASARAYLTAYVLAAGPNAWKKKGAATAAAKPAAKKTAPSAKPAAKQLKSASKKK